MEKTKKIGRPRTGRVKKQMFLNPDIVDSLKSLSAEQVNTLLANALRPNVSTLKDFETAHKIGELEVKYRPNKYSDLAITNSQAAANIMQEVWSDKIEWVEEFVLLLLDNANHPLGFVKLFQGGLNWSLIDSRIVFGIALVAQASGFIVCHNHPSGELKPSQADKDVTRSLLEQSRIMGISMIDHIIISSKGFYSFKDAGLMY